MLSDGHAERSPSGSGRALGGIGGLDGIAAGWPTIAEVLAPLRQFAPPVHRRCRSTAGSATRSGRSGRRSAGPTATSTSRASDPAGTGPWGSSARPSSTAYDATAERRRHADDPPAGAAARRGRRGDLAGAQADVLTADPLDLVLRMEQVWDAANLWAQATRGPAGPARQALFATGAFARSSPMPDQPAWDHLGYAYAIENTRAPQILARVVRAFRSGEGLGVPSVPTQRWLDATEALLFGAANPFAAWLSTSAVRPDAEAVRRNAYFRLFGMDLAHGTDANAPYPYDKAEASNRGFVAVFEELLFELWRAIENVRNLVAGNTTDDDRIYRLAEQLGFMLRSRRSGRGARSRGARRDDGDGLGGADAQLEHPGRHRPARRGDELGRPAARDRGAGRAGAALAGGLVLRDGDELSLLLRALEAGWVTGSGAGVAALPDRRARRTPAAAARAASARRRGAPRHHRVGGRVRARPQAAGGADHGRAQRVRRPRPGAEGSRR